MAYAERFRYFWKKKKKGDGCLFSKPIYMKNQNKQTNKKTLLLLRSQQAEKFDPQKERSKV